MQSTAYNSLWLVLDLQFLPGRSAARHVKQCMTLTSIFGISKLLLVIEVRIPCCMHARVQKHRPTIFPVGSCMRQFESLSMCQEISSLFACPDHPKYCIPVLNLSRPEYCSLRPRHACRSHRNATSDSSTSAVQPLASYSDGLGVACSALVGEPPVPGSSPGGRRWDGQSDEIAVAAAILRGPSKHVGSSELWREGSRAALLAADQGGTQLRSSNRRVRLTERAASAKDAEGPHVPHALQSELPPQKVGFA